TAEGAAIQQKLNKVTEELQPLMMAEALHAVQETLREFQGPPSGKQSSQERYARDQAEPRALGPVRSGHLALSCSSLVFVTARPVSGLGEGGAQSQGETPSLLAKTAEGVGKKCHALCELRVCESRRAKVLQ